MQRSSLMKEYDISHRSVTTTISPTRSFLSSSYPSWSWVLKKILFLRESLIFIRDLSVLVAFYYDLKGNFFSLFNLRIFRF